MSYINATAQSEFQSGSSSKRSDVYEQLDILQKDLARIDETVKTLEARLSPVSIRLQTIEKVDSEATPREIHCAISERIIESINTVRVFNYRIESVLNALQI